MGLNKRIALLSAAIITFGLGALYLGLTMKSPRTPKDPNSWDILIFTQTWPNTLCYTWKSQNTNHTCNFPSKKNLWTVHGIWPTKFGTFGPSFCNSSLPFDSQSIFGIQNKLNEYWTDLELQPINVTENSSTNSSNALENKKSIWFHEWEKHGTCAISLPALDSEFKYFYQGIEWSEKYNIKDILEKSGIKVNSTLYVADYWKAVKSVLNTNAWIECTFKNDDTKEQMLAEIRICFDKTLNLINCNGIMKTRQATTKTHSLTNCDAKKPILFLDYVPEHNISMDSNSTVDKHSKVLFRPRRKVSYHSDEYINKISGRRKKLHLFRNQPKTLYNHNRNRSSSYPYIKRKNWDILTFSQSWPYTFCHTWTANSNTHICNLPANRNQWTIHGIWPTKIGAFGPFFCNNQSSFNLNSLRPIIPELHNRWTEIKGSTTWSRKEGVLWSHEWIKHGTCASSLPSLNSELKYFKQGLDWSKEYQLTDLLNKGGIVPNKSYPVTQFWHTLKTGLGKNPFIDCYVDKDTKKVYIDEIRLCFDKKLSLINCDYFNINSNRPNTNCPLNEEIIYKGATD